MLKRAVPVGVAGIAGVAVAVGFEPYAVFWLIFPALAVFAWLVHSVTLRAAALLGFVFGLGFMLTLLPWIRVIGVDAWIGLAILEAAFFVITGVGMRLVASLPAWPLWSASVWLLGEELRSVLPWGGFPWGRLAFASIDTPFDRLMTWGGTALTSAAIAVGAFALAGLVARDSRVRREGIIQVGVVTLLVVAASLFTWHPTLADTPSTNVISVQGNVPGTGADSFGEQREVLNNHVGATLAIAADIKQGSVRRPDIVLWPENSTDIDPFQDASAYASISQAADAVGVPILVGAMVIGDDPHTVYNEGIVWSPGTGPGETYVKRHPVPFGEYIPYRAEIAHWFQRLNQIPRDMVAGTTPGVLPIDGTVLGDLICFEVAYDGLVDDVVNGGARMLVVQTNNATYMGTGQVEQQFAIGRLRAIQTGRYVVITATNGVSGVVAPDGQVVQRLPTRQTAWLQQDVPQYVGVSPGVRWGLTLRWVLVVAGLATMLMGLVTYRRGHTSALGRRVRHEQETQQE